ncbi:phytanoyl-CoA dioxygenase family protein [Legionella spiritensis]|uniref:phytanoyl-CoA dioxygenase family protein n=1 Tax=Legionella spiritensis TaxID=452 RepID=UPI000F7196A0|nr:phytanoyl-CoA dioxygenase family protein [Legionella spiritensis]VEG91381.1 phytanoyl-CoA dioxygenase [Legionella spiritensis]
MDLSPAQIDRFLREGYLVIENFFSRDVCETLMKRMEHIIAGHKETIPATVFSTRTNEHALTDYFLNSGDRIHFFFEPGAFDNANTLIHPLEKSLNKVGHALHEKDSVFRQYSYDPRIKTICRQLGFKKTCLLQSMYIFKQPRIGAEVRCHQDATFLHARNSPVIGFWLALEDATTENGCLQVLPTPHTTPLKKKMFRSPDDVISFEEYDATPWNEEHCISLEVKQGSLVLLHGHLPHKSHANLSDKSRHAYTLHAIDADNPYPDSNWLRCPQGLPQWPDPSFPLSGDAVTN